MTTFTRHLFLLILLIINSGITLQTPVAAQNDSITGQRYMLVSGADLSGQGYPLAVVDLQEGSSRTLVTFASRPACPPTIFPDGQSVIYELADAQQPPSIYQIEVDSGERTALLAEDPAGLTCPVVSPDGSSIAWIQHTEEGHQLVLTDAAGEGIRPLASHPNIYDVTWSPTNQVLIYNVTSNNNPFPSLHVLPRQELASPRLFWNAQQGLVKDYEWIPDGTGLLVIYDTDEFTAITRLSVDCVIGPGPVCEAEPLVEFPPNTNITLLNAYSPIERKVIVSVQLLDETTEMLASELWIIDLIGNTVPRPLTHSPEILKTGAAWSADGKEIMFIGSTFDEESQTLRGALYSMKAEVDALPHLRFRSDVFSPVNILHWYR
jgi:Tol biopolymer transport system component